MWQFNVFHRCSQSCTRFVRAICMYIVGTLKKQIQIFTCNVCTEAVCKVLSSVCMCLYICVQIMTAFCVFQSNFCQWLDFFFIIAVLMVIVFSIRLWPIAKFVFWNCHCGAYCVTCDSNQNGAEQNKTYSERCSHTKLNQRSTHTHFTWQKHMPFIIFQFRPFFTALSNH